MNQVVKRLWRLRRWRVSKNILQWGRFFCCCRMKRMAKAHVVVAVVTGRDQVQVLATVLALHRQLVRVGGQRRAAARLGRRRQRRRRHRHRRRDGRGAGRRLRRRRRRRRRLGRLGRRRLRRRRRRGHGRRVTHLVVVGQVVVRLRKRQNKRIYFLSSFSRSLLHLQTQSFVWYRSRTDLLDNRMP